jgi:hypothetical protein
MKKYYIKLTEQERSQIIHSLIDKKNAFTQFIFQNQNFFIISCLQNYFIIIRQNLVLHGIITSD